MHGLSEILHGASKRTASPASGLVQGHDGSAHSEEGVQKPFINPPAETGSIEFIGTALSFRGQGAASAVIQHMLDHLPYRNYLIEEVADTNAPAMRLYEKLGFTEYRRKPLSSMQARRSGINHMVSLRLEKS
ncbi:GNAT family N-acetyltransferase [Paenibacillus sp. FSL M8-0334]|uniref:GNAT family N-acetyltransferase n=1 Tax=Paenibacillus sp. FSL M8-0334 TaxID=2921623 RepID=UPI0030FA7547